MVFYYFNAHCAIEIFHYHYCQCIKSVQPATFWHLEAETLHSCVRLFQRASLTFLLFSYLVKLAREAKVVSAGVPHVCNLLQAKSDLSEMMFFGRAAPFRFVQEENRPCSTQIHTNGRRWAGWMQASQCVRPTLSLLLLPWLHTSALVMPEGKATAGSMEVLTTHNAVHWSRRGLLNRWGPLTLVDISQHFHLRWPRVPLSADIGHRLWWLHVGKWSLGSHNGWNGLSYKNVLKVHLIGDMMHTEVKSSLLPRRVSLKDSWHGQRMILPYFAGYYGDRWPVAVSKGSVV